MRSILVCIDNSPASPAAVEYAVRLAKFMDAKISIRLLLDINQTWERFQFRPGGFVGAGVFLYASEKVSQIMQDVGETILSAVLSKIGDHLLIDSAIGDDDYEEIVDEAAKHDLIVIACPPDGEGILPVRRQREKAAFAVASAENPRPVVLVFDYCPEGTQFHWIGAELIAPASLSVTFDEVALGARTIKGVPTQKMTDAIVGTVVRRSGNGSVEQQEEESGTFLSMGNLRAAVLWPGQKEMKLITARAGSPSAKKTSRS